MVSEKWDLGLQAAVTQLEQGIQTQNELLTGYDEETRVWELIIKYQGNLGDILQSYPQIEYEELIAGYGILQVPETLLSSVSNLPEIEYFEKPKRIIEAQTLTIQQRCIEVVKQRFPYLTGEGVIIAVLDSGIQEDLREFQNENGQSRILEINNLGRDGVDITGHGTQVASIAAGSSVGVANKADLLIIRLGNASELSFGKTSDILRGVTYAIRYAISRNQPIVINLSYGTVMGSHRGDSLLDRFLDNASEIWKTVICVGAGNEGDQGGHVGIILLSDSITEIEFVIERGEAQLIMEGFLGFHDEIAVILVSPRNETIEIREEKEFFVERQGYRIYSFVTNATPYSSQKEILLEWNTTSVDGIEPGLWKIRIKTGRIVDGRVDWYITSKKSIGTGTQFLTPDPIGTITIPATASKVISVGATDLSGTVYAPFSGRGFEQASFGYYQNKPDVVAAGVNVPAIGRNGELVLATGTSFSTPIVSGMAALLLEWGIVRGNDPFLYGQKCKARIIQGTRKVVGIGAINYPNPLVGWGYACDIILKN